MCPCEVKALAIQEPDIVRQLTLKHQGCIKMRSLLIAVESLRHFLRKEAPGKTQFF